LLLTTRFQEDINKTSIKTLLRSQLHKFRMQKAHSKQWSNHSYHLICARGCSAALTHDPVMISGHCDSWLQG
jgi:hypothetical protein